ncbi:hypothetical protein [Desulfovirgula thermocuniculi]|uniref:hypothetical protein n=1 Tax=Desulfovirgula thermocuniculi TaxID=348842 RepID=UPI000429A971|nr:hypothetical protein [Desulfovirgula thermocuniculi]
MLEHGCPTGNQEKVPGGLPRKKAGDYLEVNILGDGTLGGRRVKIVGESKAQLSKNDVDRFLKRKLGKLKGTFPEVFGAKCGNS